jgi:hypothetical protein
MLSWCHSGNPASIELSPEARPTMKAFKDYLSSTRPLHSPLPRSPRHDVLLVGQLPRSARDAHVPLWRQPNPMKPFAQPYEALDRTLPPSTTCPPPNPPTTTRAVSGCSKPGARWTIELPTPPEPEA